MSLLPNIALRNERVKYLSRLFESMTFNPSDDYGDGKICLTVEGEYQGRSISAYCSPDSEGQTYFADGEVVGNPIIEQHGAPFQVDIVLHGDVYPELDEMRNIRDEIGDVIAAQFEEKTNTIFDKLEDADDSFEAIMEIDADDL